MPEKTPSSVPAAPKLPKASVTRPKAASVSSKVSDSRSMSHSKEVRSRGAHFLPVFQVSLPHDPLMLPLTLHLILLFAHFLYQTSIPLHTIYRPTLHQKSPVQSKISPLKCRKPNTRNQPRINMPILHLLAMMAPKMEPRCLMKDHAPMSQKINHNCSVKSWSTRCRPNPATSNRLNRLWYLHPFLQRVARPLGIPLCRTIKSLCSHPLLNPHFLQKIYPPPKASPNKSCVVIYQFLGNPVSPMWTCLHKTPLNTSTPPHKYPLKYLDVPHQ